MSTLRLQPRKAFAWLALFALGLAAPHRLAAEELRTLTGKTYTGSLVRITDSDIVFKTDVEEVLSPLTQTLSLDLRPLRKTEADKYTLVQLLDDTALRCKEVSLDAREAHLTLLSGAKLSFPISGISAVLRDAQEARVLDQFQKFIKQRVRTDRIFVLREGELNPLQGLLGEIDPEKQTIVFTREGADAVTLPLGRLQGLAFLRNEAPADTPLCKVIDQDGNTLVAAKLAYDGGRLQVTTTFGSKVQVPRENLARLDFNFGKLTFLSELDSRVLPAPLFGDVKNLVVARDQKLEGTPIVLQDRAFAKGLVLEAGVEMEFTLGGKYKDLKAFVGTEEGIDRVTLTVFCDGDQRFHEPVSAKKIRNLTVNVKDVNVVRIVVMGRDWTGFGYSSPVILGDARVSQ